MAESIKESIDELREELATIRSAVQKIKESGAREKTILILLAHYTGLPQKTIKKVLFAVEEIEEEYFSNE